MKSNYFYWFAGALMGCLCAQLVFAHAGRDDRFKVRVTQDYAVVQFQLEPALLHAFDDDQNGTLSTAEYLLHKSDLTAWIDSHLQLKTGNDQVVHANFADMPIEHFNPADKGAPVGYIKIIRRYPIAELAGPVYLKVDLFADRLKPKPFLLLREKSWSEGHLTNDSPVLLLQRGVAKSIEFKHAFSRVGEEPSRPEQLL